MSASDDKLAVTELLYTYAEDDRRRLGPPLGRSAKVRLIGAAGSLTCINPLVTAFFGDLRVRHPR